VTSARQRRRARIYVVGLVSMVAAGACSGDGTTGTTQPGGSETVVEVTLTDFSFVGLPASVPAGAKLTVVNKAATELHELVAFRLPEGEERGAAELATLPPNELIAALGQPVTVLLAAPGGPKIDAVGDGTLAEPGRYVVFCFIPTGVEPQVYLDALAETEGGPPEIEGAGPPHFVHGMIADLVVG
jgi:hypothetical protein